MILGVKPLYTICILEYEAVKMSNAAHGFEEEHLYNSDIQAVSKISYMSTLFFLAIHPMTALPSTYSIEKS